MCSSSIAADICTRIRAVPSGTTGKPKPVTKTPSSSSRSLKRIANAVSPTMIGTIAASPSSGAKPSARSRVAELPRSGVQLRDELRLAPQHPHGLERRAGDRRRERVREELRPRALREHVADLLARRDEPAGRAAERLAQRGGDHVDLAEQAVVLGDAAAGLAHHARAVRVVDDERRVVRARRARRCPGASRGRPPSRRRRR